MSNNKLTKEWWKKGTGTEILGTIAVVVAAIIMFAFLDFAIKATEFVRTSVIIDAVSDGAAVYGNKSINFSNEDAKSMAYSLLEQNEAMTNATLTLTEFSTWESRNIIPNKKVTVLDTSMAGELGSVSSDEIIIMPKSAHEIALAALDAAITIADDERYGYGNSVYGYDGAWEFNLDCGAFVCKAYGMAGVNIQYNAWGDGETYDGWYVSCVYKSMFERAGFEFMTFTSVEDLLPGDILINEKGSHTEMYAGNYQTIGAHRKYDKQAGDFVTGKEICKVWIGSSWKYVFRYVGN